MITTAAPVSLLAPTDLFGLFELDSAGTVLYSRVNQHDQLKHQRPNVVGRNFYDEVAPFENLQEFRSRLNSFAENNSSVDSFTFVCEFADFAMRIRVMLVRISERSDSKRAKSIIVDIRKV